MAVLVDLPPELLEEIFYFLGSIDDVHSLGRACKKTYDVVQRPVIYVAIMRSIIGQSPQHRYDFQLCKMLHLHKKIVKHMQQHGTLLPATRPSADAYTLNDWERDLALATTPPACNINCLPDETVYDILARYQGLRVLEDLWLERQLGENDYMSADTSSDADEVARSYQVLLNRHEIYMEGELPSRRWTTPGTAGYTTLNADQRARFQSAVTYIWLLNEIRWVLTNFEYPIRFNVQIMVLQKCKKAISGQGRVSLLDELDQYAVYKFMYHHLLPLSGSSLADRGISKLPFTFDSDFTKDTGHSSRLLQLFLTTGQTYLQPPDLIDLIVRSKAARKPPYPVVAFPATTLEWQRPSPNFAFPQDMHVPISDEQCKSLFLRAALTHLNLITRSSFHQTRVDISPSITAPLSTHAFAFRDHAAYHFFDRAMVAFEARESRESGKRDIREVFLKQWVDEMWSVWWWANGEDKARAKMERWREAPVEGREVRRA